MPGDGYGAALTSQQQKAAADYIRSLAFYEDNVTLHNGPSTDDSVYVPLLGYPSFTGNEIQWIQGDHVHDKVLEWRTRSEASGHPWVVSLDEPWSPQTDLDPFRTWDVWGSYVAGASGCEFFQTGDLQFDDFRTKEAFYRTLVRARRFLEDSVPYKAMNPADALLSGTEGYVLAKAGQVYLVYLTAGGTPSLNLAGASGAFSVRWFDPRNGGALQTGSVASVTGGGVRSLGSPPSNPSLDWAILVGSQTAAPGEAAVAQPMTVTAYNNVSGAVTIDFGAACLATGHTIVYGPLSGIASYAYTGQVCGIGTSGSATFNPGAGNVFWIVAGTTSSVEGSYGTSSAGTERPEAIGLAACDLPQGPSPGC